MTSYRKMNKRAKMQGSLNFRVYNVLMSKMLDTRKKFPHVKYINQLIKEDRGK